MSKQEVPGSVVLLAREMVDAVARYKRAEARLAEARSGIESSDRILRGCRSRLRDEMAAYGIDDGGDIPAAAEEICRNFERLRLAACGSTREGSEPKAKATGEPQ